MCTIAILLDVVAGAPLVVAANRDEIYARPSRPPESLGDGIAGGVDALSGGTWLAIRRDGRFTAVTNQRALAPVVPGLRSRGLAVRELVAADDPERYVAALDPTRYASMNLVWGDAGAVSIAYVRRDGAGRPGGAPGGRPVGSIDIERLPRGIHVLCNDRLGTDGFPRGVRLHDAIAAAPLAWPAIVPALEAALADHTRVGPSRIDRIRSAAKQGSDSPCGEDPPCGDPSRIDRIRSTAEQGSDSPCGEGPPCGDPPSHRSSELARELTAVCIHAPDYGTRSSTIFAAGRGELIAYLHADGPPCTTPFTDRRGLL
jgi:uncharacterized protein with NRDE domain